MEHDASTMKVGTDAVVLGAWVKVPAEGAVLDVGTGSGILALMIAQRTQSCLINAIDIDSESVKQATSNFMRSRWSYRLKAFCTDFSQLEQTDNDGTFDLVISNPPFFTSVFKTKHFRKNLARHTDTLSHKDLISNSFRILKSTGTFAVVVPADQSQQFEKMAFEAGYSCQRKCMVVPVEGRDSNRVMYEFVKKTIEKPEFETFTIRLLNGSFTPAYSKLLGDFYLGLG